MPPFGLLMGYDFYAGLPYRLSYEVVCMQNCGNSSDIAMDGLIQRISAVSANL